MSSRGRKKVQNRIISSVFHMSEKDLEKEIKRIDALEYGAIIETLRKNNRPDLQYKMNACTITGTELKMRGV